MMNAPYTPDFYAGQSSGSVASARAVVSRLLDVLGPVGSVVDVGCGVGGWSAEWVRRGATEVLGIDGAHVRSEDLLIDQSDFRVADLGSAFPDLPRRYDLCLCLEVAEHLPATRADALVDFLVGASDTVVFSAAIPGQGGTHHVNEQWPEYWTERFGHRGYEVFDVVRPAVWDDVEVEPWYRQNIVVLATGAAAARLGRVPVAPMPLRVVHPDQWHLSRTSPPSVRSSLASIAQLPAAVLRSATRRRR